MLMMLPFEAPTIFEGIHKSYFRMPRVVKDQKSKFENDDLFRQLSHESAVKYTGFKDRPMEERQMKFIANCQEGHTEVSVVQSGNQFTLMFNPIANPAYENEGCDFDKELGKVHIKSGFILNGVCVRWRGWVDLQRLEGFGCLEFDEQRAYLEDAMLRQQIDKQQQQSCNNSGPNHQQSPLGRLNHHPLGAPPPHLNPLSSLPPIGLNPSCLGPPGPPGSLSSLSQGPPPVSLADSVSHYGNAAIAAAAAAAFHQALGVGGPNGPHGLGPPPSMNGLPPPGAPLVSGSPYLANYNATTNGTPTILPPQQQANMTMTRSSPPGANSLITNGAGGSPERESVHNNNNNSNNNSSQATIHQRQSMKRSHEEQTQLDDVDVVSDIHAHDLDFPPRRIFKSSPITTAPHHHHHHHHHRATRRA